MVLLMCAAALCAQDAKTPSRFVLESTALERSKAGPILQPVPVDSFILPHAHAANVLPNPYVCKARSRATLYPMPERVVWRIVPKKEHHEEYLERRDDADTRTRRLALVDWCEKHHLPDCAEFELRRLLYEIGDFRKPGYRSVLNRWLKHAERHESDYVFPLPIEGEWHVVRDVTRHHRSKHGAAFAFDLVIRKKGKMYRGSRSSLRNHYAFGKPVLAQADGIVMQVTDKHPDIRPGKPGARELANTLTVDYGGGIVGFYGHLKQGSAKVKPGQRVSAGEVLALVGNSGASGLPHLHFSLLDQAYFSLKGRFRYEMKRSGKWGLIDGKDLVEGAIIRNPAGIFGSGAPGDGAKTAP